MNAAPIIVEPLLVVPTAIRQLPDLRSIQDHKNISFKVQKGLLGLAVAHKN